MIPENNNKKRTTHQQTNYKEIESRQSQANADDLYRFDESTFITSELTPVEPLKRHSNLPEDQLSEQQIDSLIYYNHVTYLLYALSFFTAGFIWAVPIFMNYIRRQDASDTWLATHFDWQIKTFWYSIIAVFIGIVIISFSIFGLGVGLFSESTGLTLGSGGVFFAGVLFIVWAVIWHFYRIVKGWIALSDKRPIQ